MNEHVHPTFRSAIAGIYNTIQEAIGSPLRMSEVEPEQKENSIVKEMISDFQNKELFATIEDEPEYEDNEDDERLAEQEHKWEADNDR